MVGIDDETFDELRERSGRSRARSTAQVIDRICAGGREAIAYDVQFTEPTDAGARTTR